MDNPITRAEHLEFIARMESEHKRLEEEDKRQNQRINTLEENVRQIGTLTAAVNELALSMKGMAKEQEKLVEEVNDLKQKPAKRWETIVEQAIGLLVAALVGFLLARLGL